MEILATGQRGPIRNTATILDSVTFCSDRGHLVVLGRARSNAPVKH